MTASLVTRSQTWPLSAGNYQHIPKHPWVDGIQKIFFFPNFWIVAKSQFENPGMAVVLSSPLWARLGSICKENMDFPFLGVQKYLQQSIWFEIHRHRKTFSISAECDLAETQMPQHHHCRQAPTYHIQNLKIFFHVSVQRSQRYIQQAGCSDTTEMVTVPLRPVDVRF